MENYNVIFWCQNHWYQLYILCMYKTIPLKRSLLVMHYITFYLHVHSHADIQAISPHLKFLWTFSQKRKSWNKIHVKIGIWFSCEMLSSEFHIYFTWNSQENTVWNSYESCFMWIAQKAVLINTKKAILGFGWLLALTLIFLQFICRYLELLLVIGTIIRSTCPMTIMLILRKNGMLW